MKAIIDTASHTRLVRLALLPVLLSACTLPALAQTHYMDLQGKQKYPPTTPVTLTGGNAVTLEAGWYLCKGPINYTNTLAIRGDVNLILGDNCDMRVTGNSVSGSYSAGIKVAGAGNSLTVWAQWANSTGNLVVHGGYASAGIGGGYEDTGGAAITINGGTVHAEGGGGAGVGGGYKGTAAAITINGGVVNATGSYRSAGIGSGEYGSGGAIVINGGTVNATGGYQGGAGIGGGYQGTGHAVTINGGVVNATGGGDYPGSGGAGIGGGDKGAAGAITLGGGMVNATGNHGSAGIGGGADGNGGTITILGGTVNAMGGNHGAGIGGGAGGNGGTITILGGTVNATGGNHGAGIGGGHGDAGGAIQIAGSAHVTAQGSGGGANIGQGQSQDGQKGLGISPIPKPANTAVAAGGNAVFRVTVDRTAHTIAYQWQQSANGGKSWSRLTDGPGVTGATRATLTLSGVTARMNGHLYRCVVRLWRVGEDSSIIYTTGSGRLGVRP